jgi:hypothetical protein
MISTNTVLSSRSGRFRSRYVAGTLASGAVLVLAAACSSSSGTNSSPPMTGPTICGNYPVTQSVSAATCASPGGAATGPKDMHCDVGGKQMVQATGMCPMGALDSGADDSSASATDNGADGGAENDAAVAAATAAGVADGTCGDSDYSPTMYGQSGSDDDCKYDVSWTSTPICENGNVFFTVKAKKRAFADGGSALADEPPLTGATVQPEVTLNCTHIAPNPSMPTSFIETPAGSGIYKVGPVVFDEKGKWDVRFHFNECCDDGPADSPHGHAAFWINVP